MNTDTTQLKISVIDDEPDILTLYKDFLIGKGHEVFSYLNADNILKEFRKSLPDIALMDYKMVGHKSGIDAAIEILTDFPLFPILFISAYGQLHEDILNYPIFKHKTISILIKPVFLQDLENSILSLVKH
ncbi:MAG TPA: response regulator [Nitrososphaeraceae archaeon]|nr:response regulator [Nitrososphaeraceae archaeon]